MGPQSYILTGLCRAGTHEFTRDSLSDSSSLTAECELAVEELCEYAKVAKQVCVHRGHEFRPRQGTVQTLMNNWLPTESVDDCPKIPKQTFQFNGYCRLCFRLRAALLCWFSLSFATYFGLHGHLQVCRILHVFICLFIYLLLKKRTKNAAKQNPLSI
jgi:hypothetical protein